MRQIVATIPSKASDGLQGGRARVSTTEAGGKQYAPGRLPREFLDALHGGVGARPDAAEALKGRRGSVSLPGGSTPPQQQ